jgi:uncharacterized protein YodC (DUF2158 family)
MIIEIEVGDVVYLKAEGSPEMTVVAKYKNSEGENQVGVVWFDSDSHLQTGTFPPPALMIVSEQK